MFLRVLVDKKNPSWQGVTVAVSLKRDMQRHSEGCPMAQSFCRLLLGQPELLLPRFDPQTSNKLPDRMIIWVVSFHAALQCCTDHMLDLVCMRPGGNIHGISSGNQKNQWNPKDLKQHLGHKSFSTSGAGYPGGTPHRIAAEEGQKCGHSTFGFLCTL